MSACSDDALDARFQPCGGRAARTQFWLSSVLNESVVHGFDAANAAGRPADVAPDIAAALISNHLAMLTFPRGRCSGPSLRTPSGARADPAVAGHRQTGPARSLLLTVTRRLPLSDRAATNISVDGDTDLAQHWLGNTAQIAD